MGVFRSLTGILAVEIVSADIPGLLSAVTEQGIQLFHAVTKGELTLAVKIRRSDWRNLKALCNRRGERVIILSRMGLYWPVKSLLKRPVLVAGLAVLLWLSLYLPGRVLFVRVEGNLRIPSARILEAAAESGIGFWASRREVRSERMKNALLEEVPQLQWAGVNTYGCLAVISVRERSDEPVITNTGGGVGNIVAACDGIILSVTADRGTCLCQPGQAVTGGQVLISGYTDLGITIQGTQAQGEVFAQTKRHIRAITPLEVWIPGEDQERIVKYSLLVGKKRINFWKGSGIWEGTCGRMYEEYYITLPGGFQLPLALIKETITVSDPQTVSLEPTMLQPRLERFGKSCVMGQMVSGNIIGEKSRFLEENQLLVLEGEYLCTEMIGRLRQEKIGE